MRSTESIDFPRSTRNVTIQEEQPKNPPELQVKRQKTITRRTFEEMEDFTIKVQDFIKMRKKNIKDNYRIGSLIKEGSYG